MGWRICSPTLYVDRTIKLGAMNAGRGFLSKADATPISRPSIVSSITTVAAAVLFEVLDTMARALMAVLLYVWRRLGGVRRNVRNKRPGQTDNQGARNNSLCIQVNRSFPKRARDSRVAPL
jgi:hypothetical protein